MKTRTFLAALSLGFLASCAQMSPHEAIQNLMVRKAAQSARTRGDHDGLGKYFEDAANEMQGKAEEQKKLLQHYEEKSYLYGREAQDLISHTSALVRRYGETAQENRKEAALHRQMALDGTKDSTANSGKMASAAFMEEQQKSN